MKTTTDEKYRVRYGWVYEKGDEFKDSYSFRHRKNVLVTIQKNDFVFFGIARCKLPQDHFRKVEGRELALARAQNSVNSTNMGKDTDAYGALQPRASFYLDSSELMGYCKVKYVKTLLQHFENLDQKKK